MLTESIVQDLLKLVETKMITVAEIKDEQYKTEVQKRIDN